MPVYAGFDLGGTQLKYGLIDGRGALLFKDKAPTPPTIEGFLDLVGRIFRELRERSPEPVEAAGFGVPGIYDLRSRKILQSPNFSGLDEFDIYPAVARVLDVPFWIDNDANMAAYGEWTHGAGRGVQSLVLLTIGTGIGGGLILGGRLWQGGCGYAGEVGHIIVNRGRRDVQLRPPGLPRGGGVRHGHRPGFTGRRRGRRRPSRPKRSPIGPGPEKRPPGRLTPGPDASSASAWGS